MQRLPTTTCHDPFHSARSFDEQQAVGIQKLHCLGEWTAMAYECRSCGYSHMRHVTLTWIDKVGTVCPGCDAIRLDWDDADPMCGDCQLRDVRMVTFYAHEEHSVPMDWMDVEALIEDWPSIHWPWGRVLEELDR